MKQGRPTEYNESILTKAQEYLKSCKDVYDPETRTWDVNLPSIEGLALHLGIARSTVYEWRDHEDKQDFSDILEQVLTAQAKQLINNGLSGKYNATITKVMATKHGYREGIEQTGKDGGAIIVKDDSKASEIAKEYEQKLKENI